MGQENGIGRNPLVLIVQNTMDYELGFLSGVGLARVDAFLIEALAITNRSDFCLLRADVNNLFAQLEMDDGNWQEAKDHAQAALADAICDGSPYCYMPALVKAERLLDQIKHFYPMEISHEGWSQRGLHGRIPKSSPR